MTEPHPDYIPRRHRDRSMAAKPQSEITDMPEQDREDQRQELANVVNRIEASPQTPLTPAPPTLQQPLSRGEAATVQANSVIDLVTSHTLEQINDLRTQLNELESLLLQDTAHVKAHIASHVVLSKVASEQTNSISATIKTLREERAQLINANVRG